MNSPHKIGGGRNDTVGRSAAEALFSADGRTPQRMVLCTAAAIRSARPLVGERLVADALSKLHQHEVEIEALLDGANAELANEQDEAQVEIAAPLEALHEAWKTLVMNSGDVSANYIKHLVERVEIDGQHIRVVPRSEFVGAEDVAFREPGVESLPEVTPNTEPKLSTAERRARSAAEVRAVMEAEGLTRAQVARRFGWSRAWITKLLGRAPRRRTSVNRPVAERRQTLPVGEGQHATRA